MSYIAPYIDNTGMHVPTYAEIRDDLIQQMKSIFGEDIYIDPDSKDYQQISIFARKIYDTNALGLLVYNNRTANTAIGVGLDNLCALVGIKRRPASYSTVQLTITGDPSTVITNGKASDGTNTWNLPETVTIPDGGVIIVEATCDVSGSIEATPNSINTIVTPVFGWSSVTNTYVASQGSDVETDAELRARYNNATFQPSKTVIEGIINNVEACEGVKRVKLYENDTNTPDANGLPPHSITAIVEGGLENDIATAIYFKKTPGCYTNGDVEIEITTLYGSVTPIRFYRPTYKPIYAKVSLKKLAGYNNSYAVDIQNAIVDYIDAMQISETVYRSILWSVAVQVMASISSPAFSVTDIKLSTDGTTYSDADIEVAFNEVAQIEVDNITVEVS